MCRANNPLGFATQYWGSARFNIVVRISLKISKTKFQIIKFPLAVSRGDRNGVCCQKKHLELYTILNQPQLTRACGRLTPKRSSLRSLVFDLCPTDYKRCLAISGESFPELVSCWYCLALPRVGDLFSFARKSNVCELQYTVRWKFTKFQQDTKHLRT